MNSSGKSGSEAASELLRQTLLDLANLPDSQWAQFRRRYRREYVPFPSADDLVNWQMWLRRVWEGHDLTPGDHRNDPQAADDRDVRFALAAWTREATRDLQSWVFEVGPPYAIRPNYKILALALAIGVTELSSKMGVCANPDCPARYFLKGRKTQRFCDIPACTAYGQREHKREWWGKHGQEWKEKREAEINKRKRAKAKKA